MNSWQFALRNLSRNRRRNFATGSAVALGFMGLVMLSGYVYRADNYLRIYTLYSARTGHMMIYKKGGFEKYAFRPKEYSLTPNEQSQIEEILKTVPGVAVFGPQLHGMGLVGNGCTSLPFMAVGIRPELDRTLHANADYKKWGANLKQFLRGKELWEYDAGLAPVALSQGLAKALGKVSVHDDHADAKPVLVTDCAASDARKKLDEDSNVQLLAGSWEGSLSAQDAEVVAHYTTGYSETDNTSLLAPLDSLQKLYDTQNVTLISVWLKDESYVKAAIEDFSGKARAKGLELDIVPWDNERLSPIYAGTIQFLNTLVNFLGTILISIAALSVVNSTTMTIIERSQEIGTLRSLGFRRIRIRLLFVQEAALLCIIALIIGGCLAEAAMFGINSSHVIYHPPGVAGGLQLLLIPKPGIHFILGIALLVVTLLATLVAVSSQTKKNISSLLLGVQR